jgi:putative FmdB family regulatory protein
LPLYEYQCARCGRFEVIRKFSDSPLLTCPTCGGEIQKLASAPAIQFKGTGWYITDYARKSTGGEASGKSKTEGDSSSSASGSKDGGSSSKDGASSSKDSGTKSAASSDGSKSKSSGESSTSKGSGESSTSKGSSESSSKGSSGGGSSTK